MINKGRKAQQEPVFQGPGVSDLLRTTRERAGHDLQTVSQVLRIRFVYLQAIEDGRFEDLPGKTYVVGFVRAYAEYLGLASDEVVKRFKEEIAGMDAKSEFVFPSPVTEQSVPGGAIILIGLILLGAAYGGWYFLSSQDRSMAELVPDLPAKFAEMVDKVKDNKKEESTEATTKSEKAAAVAEEKTVEPVSPADTQDMAKKAMEAVEKAAAAEEKTDVQPVETVKVEETPTPAVKEKVEEKVEEVVAEVEKKIEEAAEVTAEKVEETTAATSEAVEEKVEEVTETVAAATTQAVEEEKEPEVKKPEPMKEKVVLKAVDYAWIQVTNDQGTVLHTQVLNEGDEYQVPATQNLVLRTGNAGGLEIYVDGKKAPSIGEAGEVRRKVWLVPSKLMAGNAVES